MSIGTPGNGTPQHIAVELLRAQTGIDIVHVPYKGAAPATTAALAGEVTMALVGAPPVLPHLATGKLVALAVTQPQRSPLVAEVPTVGEALGIMADDDFVAWYGLLAPARAPAAAVQALERAAFTVLRRPETRSRLAALGTDLQATPRAAFAERMRKESARYAEIIRRFGIKAA
ncbi:tripartite tricarboxylate transporter substrate-binding protein [Ramlibacter sp. 2FC]|uniref:tripartite tricarboxylate transporter substrate-binding protein n=1 Tax=Ramlibacter sp. 2FC TaxID=2502188 RepID=UPI0032E51CF6